MTGAAVRGGRELRIRARRDVTTALAGAYRSAFRGQGLTFEELRDYAPGDDVRWIEWNATARLGRPITKRMREERDLVLALLVDASDSLEVGFGGESKAAAVRRAAAALAASAVGAGDRIAAAAFGAGLCAKLRPGSGPSQLQRALALLESARGGAPTDAAPALDWAAERLPRHSVVVLLSDLLFPDPGPPLRRCARKHELVVLRIADRLDRLPAGLAPLRVAPTERERPALWRRRAPPPGGLSDRTLHALGADTGMLHTGARLLPSLQRFLERRARGAAA